MTCSRTVESPRPSAARRLLQQASQSLGDDALLALLKHEHGDQDSLVAGPADAADQDRRLVLRALEAVELDRRAVFVLYEIDGESMNAIAQSLGIPVNTAYSRLRLARDEFAAAVKRLRGETRTKEKRR